MATTTEAGWGLIFLFNLVSPSLHEKSGMREAMVLKPVYEMMRQMPMSEIRLLLYHPAQEADDG